MAATEFQRARTPEQQQLRREMILTAARQMLDGQPAAEVSLRELSRRVGLSKSNVVRYFPTREAVFLAVLGLDWDTWLADLERALAAADPAGRLQDRTAALAAAIAGTLNEHPRFCDLLASCPSVLEHNVPVETAREFKATANAHLVRLADLVVGRLPELDPAEAFQFAGLVWAFTAGAWPMAHPSEVIRAVLTDPCFAAMSLEFVPAATLALRLLLDGLTARG